MFEVNPKEWPGEIKEIKDFLKQFGRHIPYEVWQCYDDLVSRLKAASGGSV